MRWFALVWSISARDIKSQYSSSLLGAGWAIINPVVTIAVFWTIFSLGFKLTPVQGVPFIVWLLAGFAPWWCFAEIVSKSTESIVQNASLVKKTVFPTHALPVSITIAALLNHAIVITALASVMYLTGIEFQISNFYIFYYLLCLVAVALALSFATSALNVMSRDTSQFVGSVLQIGFWATPIFWTLSLLPENMQPYFTYNPIYYIVEGYRSAIISQNPTASGGDATAIFWLQCGTLALVGRHVFIRLRPHFADLL